MIPDRKAPPARKAPKVFRAFLVLKERPARKAPRARKDRKATRGIRAIPMFARCRLMVPLIAIPAKHLSLYSVRVEEPPTGRGVGDRRRSVFA